MNSINRTTFFLLFAIISFSGALHAANNQQQANNQQSAYDILGIEQDATPAQIRKAYRTLLLQWHPDKNLGNEEYATEKSKKIVAAFQELSDPEKKKIYDEGIARQAKIQKWAAMRQQVEQAQKYAQAQHAAEQHEKYEQMQRRKQEAEQAQKYAAEQQGAAMRQQVEQAEKHALRQSEQNKRVFQMQRAIDMICRGGSILPEEWNLFSDQEKAQIIEASTPILQEIEHRRTAKEQSKARMRAEQLEKWDAEQTAYEAAERAQAAAHDEQKQ